MSAIRRIACLHTHDSNIAVFDAAAQALGIAPEMLVHTVRSDLLAAVEAEGLTAQLREQTGALLHRLAQENTAVLLTCSSLGPVVDGLGQAQILRADAALAVAAVQGGQRVVVLCAAPSTVSATGELFSAAAQATGAWVEVRLVDGAWALFKAGERERYFERIRTAVAIAFEEGAEVVALAQASMAGATHDEPPGLHVLTSPRASVAAAVALAFRG